MPRCPLAIESPPARPIRARCSRTQCVARVCTRSGVAPLLVGLAWCITACNARACHFDGGDCDTQRGEPHGGSQGPSRDVRTFLGGKGAGAEFPHTAPASGIAAATLDKAAASLAPEFPQSGRRAAGSAEGEEEGASAISVLAMLLLAGALGLISAVCLETQRRMRNKNRVEDLKAAMEANAWAEEATLEVAEGDMRPPPWALSMQQSWPMVDDKTTGWNLLGKILTSPQASATSSLPGDVGARPMSPAFRDFQRPGTADSTFSNRRPSGAPPRTRVLSQKRRSQSRRGRRSTSSGDGQQRPDLPPLSSGDERTSASEGEEDGDAEDAGGGRSRARAARRPGKGASRSDFLGAENSHFDEEGGDDWPLPGTASSGFRGRPGTAQSVGTTAGGTTILYQSNTRPAPKRAQEYRTSPQARPFTTGSTGSASWGQSMPGRPGTSASEGPAGWGWAPGGPRPTTSGSTFSAASTATEADWSKWSRPRRSQSTTQRPQDWAGPAAHSSVGSPSADWGFAADDAASSSRGSWWRCGWRRRAGSPAQPVGPTQPVDPGQPDGPPPGASGSFWRRCCFFSCGRGRTPAAAPPSDTPGSPSVEDVAARLISEFEQHLDASREAPLDVRRNIFRDLQRQMHPDKNVGNEEAATMAFQELMARRKRYLMQ